MIDAADYSDLEGGLVRMLDRLQAEGTATGDATVDAFLREEPAAILLGLLFDQRIRAETAFAGPLKLYERLGHLDLARVAAMDREAFAAVFRASPAVHRFTNRMVDATQALAQAVVDGYDGDASRLWATGDCAAVEARARALPGFGPLKTRKLRLCLYYFGHRDLSEA